MRTDQKNAPGRERGEADSRNRTFVALVSLDRLVAVCDGKFLPDPLTAAALADRVARVAPVIRRAAELLAEVKGV